MPSTNTETMTPGQKKPAKSRVRQNKATRKASQKSAKSRNYALEPETPMLPHNKLF